MIISLGILSIFQLIIVPGLILVKIFRIKGFWENLIAAIGLSQIFNYLFVVLAVFCKIYSQTTVIILFVAEVSILIVLYFPYFVKKSERNFSDKVISFFTDYKAKIITKNDFTKGVITFFYYLILFLATYCLLRNAIIYVTHPTEVFVDWDAVVSWNKWATEWYKGLFPTQTWHYPQLWPTNLSIPYQFIGTTDVKYFSKYFANLIDFLIIAIVYILGIKKKDIGYFIGVLFTSWLMYASGSRGNGYADSPVAFWSLLTIVCLLFAEENEDEKKLILLGAFFASAAALTKQAGLWLVLVYPILIMLRKSNKYKKSWFLFFESIGIMVIMVVPWYLYKEIQIHLGLDYSELGGATSLTSINNQSIITIIRSAQSAFVETIKNPYIPSQVAFILLLCLMAFSFRNRLWRLICTLIIIPFCIGWIFFFNYQIRNLVMVVPLIAISASVGVNSLFQLDWNKVIIYFNQKKLLPFFQKFLKLSKEIINFISKKFIWFFLIFLVIILILPHWVTDNKLIRNSLYKQRSIGYAPLNELIYDYQSRNGLDGKIVTSYPYLLFLPGLEKYSVYNSTKDQEFYKLFNDPEFGYVFYNDSWCSAQIGDYLRNLMDTNKIKVISNYWTPNSGTYYFVTTCHGVCK